MGVAHWLLALLLGASGLVGCSTTPYPEVAVDMESRPVVTPTNVTQNPRTLRFSVAAMQSPRDTYEAYSRVFHALAWKLGDRDVELVQRRTYAEVNELLASGKLDAALVCTGGYLELERVAPGAVEVLAIPVVRGRTTYQSIIIVPASSGAGTLNDLRGRRFAFADELSMSGHAYVTHLLTRMGTDERSFFASVTVTHSHDRSIEAVSKGLFDGAAVDSMVFDQMVETREGLRGAVRVIHRSPEFGMTPVVASTRLPKERRDAIRKALLALSSDRDAAEALRLAGIDRFVEPPPDLYLEAQRIVWGGEHQGLAPSDAHARAGHGRVAR